MAPGAGLPLGRAGVHAGRGGRAPQRAEVAPKARLPLGRGACARAAFKGHLDVLKWLRAEGAPWDKWTCAKAAEGGNLNVFMWARKEGCPADAHASEQMLQSLQNM